MVYSQPRKWGMGLFEVMVIFCPYPNLQYFFSILSMNTRDAEECLYGEILPRGGYAIFWRLSYFFPVKKYSFCGWTASSSYSCWLQQCWKVQSLMYCVKEGLFEMWYEMEVREVTMWAEELVNEDEGKMIWSRGRGKKERVMNTSGSLYKEIPSAGCNSDA